MSHETVDRTLREALEEICGIACNADSRDERDAALDDVAEIAKAALVAPPRNCDRFETKEEAALAYAEECNAFIPQSTLWQIGEWLDWLFAEAKGECNEGKQQSEDA